MLVSAFSQRGAQPVASSPVGVRRTFSSQKSPQNKEKEENTIEKMGNRSHNRSHQKWDRRGTRVQNASSANVRRGTPAIALHAAFRSDTR